ncbi:MAG: putative bifunctional diguanylate cyclase/phosphodiesterase [Clostridium sp.]
MKKNISRYMQNDNIMIILLGILALLVDLMNIKFAYGINLTLTTVVIFYAYKRINGKVACKIAIFVYFVTVILKFRYALNFILPLEIIGVYLINQKYKKMNIIVCDLIFWIIVGIPVEFVVYYFSNPGLDLSFLYFTIFKDIINSIINIVAIDLIFTYRPLIKNRKYNERFSISFKEFLFHILMVALIIPFVINTALKGVAYYEESKVNYNEVFKRVAYRVDREIESWKTEKEKLKGKENTQFGLLKIGGNIQKIKIDKLYEDLKKENQGKNINFIIMDDRTGKVIYSTDSSIDSINIESEDVSNKDVYVDRTEEHTIKNVITWAQGNYVIAIDELDASYEATIKFIIPIAELQQKMINESLNELRVLLVFSVFLFIAAIFLNKNIFSIVTKLADITTDIPDELNSNEDLNWPQSSVSELNVLIDNFKNMTFKLKYMFHKSNVLDEKLNISLSKLEEMAYEDMLTGLGNRHSFNEYLSHLFQNHNEKKDKVSVMFIDMDHFKEINDFLGHATGDVLLTQISQRLKKVKKNNVEIFRLGGDEFVVVIISNDMNEVKAIGQQILKEINIPFELKGGKYDITASIGVSIFPNDGEDMETITKYADIAMYKCKEKGGDYVQFFNEEIKNSFLETLAIENSIKRGLEEGEFRLVFQPKINVKNKKVGGLEALVRWNSKELGALSPVKFIEIAEESGLIIDIDRWVIRNACIKNKEFQNKGMQKIPVAVNISPIHFTKGNLVECVKEALKVSGLESRYLKLEITEGVFINNSEKAVNTILELNKLGVLVSIDDFGKGYSSINEIMTLPIKEIKIDKHFITDINDDKKRQMVVKLIVELAHGFNLSVVAEGVETFDELNSILVTGCDEIQGYLFSKPLEELELFRYLSSNIEKQIFRRAKV